MSTYEEVRAQMIKKCRREMLGVLALMYRSVPMGFEEVCNALVHLELPDVGCVQDDLTYLCERGYVRWTNEKPMLPWKHRLYKLTAKGKDVYDRIERDPNLEP